MSTTTNARAAARRTAHRVQRLFGGTEQPGPSEHTAESVDGQLAPRTALVQNGFYVARSVVPTSECMWMARTFKHEASITNGKKSKNIDAVNRFPSAKTVLVDPRILGAVHTAIGTKPRYLQISDLHYCHDTALWHRDSPSRAEDSSASPDWTDTSTPYRVVKAILYLESDEAAMAVMVGSHRSPVEMDKKRVAAFERSGKHVVVGPDEEANRPYTDGERSRPLVWTARPGDVLVFDERLYHCGRRVREGHVTSETDARKFTISFVFGADDDHSARMYSYFRFARTELKYRDLGPKLSKDLARRGLVHSAGWTNFFAEHPEQLDAVHLRDPSKLQELKETFANSTSTTP